MPSPLLAAIARRLLGCVALLAATGAAALGTGDVAVQRAFPALTFSSPTALAYPPGDDTRLYVAMRRGVVKVFDNDDDAATSSTFLDIADRVSQAGGEEGLLGLAFDPDFAKNRYVYVNYVTPAPRRTVVSRFPVADDALTADPDSEELLLEFSQPYSNHNGGWIGFGPDRMLYVASGDGGSGGDPQNNAQRLDTLLGKVLRIRTDGGIPADNPFADTSGARGEIWAYGLRNPYRMGFDAVSGALWAGDVGQNAWEEIDLITRGGNYGWRVYEGNHAYNNPSGLPATDFAAPVHEYPHDDGCSVIGGTVYRGAAIPALQGRYVFTDYCTATLWALSGTSAGSAVDTVIGAIPGENPGGFTEDAAGELLLTTLGGRIYRLVPGTGATPGPFPDRLSDTGLFSDTTALAPAEDMVPYQINAPFWSDRADKQRWFRLPVGGQIGFNPRAAWKLPVGSATVKHFDITLADGSQRRLETRVFLRTREGWRGASYRWNAEETDATLVTRNEQETIQVKGAGGAPITQTWEYPGPSACLRCHTQAAGYLLGINTPQLNRRAGSPSANQLLAFEAAGLFSTDIGSPGDYARLPNPFNATLPLAERARAYLDVNCAPCHRPNGPTNVDMDLRWWRPALLMNTHEVLPSGTDLGIAGARRIDPGSRQRSLVWQRMRRLDGDRMPPLGRHVNHAAGLNLVGAWIDAGAK